MPKRRKPAKFLNTKLLEKFLRDYAKMPYKTKATLMAAVLVVLLIPIALIYPLQQPPTAPLDLTPLDIPSPQAECVVTGCANHLCLDAKIDTPYNTCDYRPEFACLKQAKCERLDSGRCGWLDTPEYLRCLSQLNSH